MTFQAPTVQGDPGRIVLLHPVTGSTGAWSATVTAINRSEIGDWTVSSHYAGNGQYGASAAGPCTFPVGLG